MNYSVLIFSLDILLSEILANVDQIIINLKHSGGKLSLYFNDFRVV